MKDRNTNERKIVISASRRTDIPAFYMPWFMSAVGRGFFEVTNPYNRTVSKVPAGSERVHTVVFWSKDFGPFLRGRYGEQLQESGYHLFFNFTINSVDRLLEPNVPALPERLVQLERLAETFGEKSILWRFDPICHYRDKAGRETNNLKDFLTIADRASACGIQRCVTSFMDHYSKIRKRLRCSGGIEFLEPSLDRKITILLRMEERLRKRGLDLWLCCEKEILEALPAGTSICGSSCIPNDYLQELYGGEIPLQKDKGQRAAAGCGCRVSVDVGSYQEHPCYHNCLFCYANPAERKTAKCGRRRKPADSAGIVSG